jgi:hypothetical protein
MATNPNYASTPTVGAAVLTAANTGTRAAPTGGATIFTPGASGAQIERITVNVNGTIATPTTLLIYRVIGGVSFLYTELQVTQTTVAAGTAVTSQTIEAVDNPGLMPIAMAPGSTLLGVLSVAAAGGVVVQVEGGSF